MPTNPLTKYIELGQAYKSGQISSADVAATAPQPAADSSSGYEALGRAYKAGQITSANISSAPSQGRDMQSSLNSLLSVVNGGNNLQSNLRVTPDKWSSTTSAYKAYADNHSSPDFVYDENVNRNQYNAIFSLASDLDKDIAYLKKSDPVVAQGLQLSRDSLNDVLASLDDEYNYFHTSSALSSLANDPDAQALANGQKIYEDRKVAQADSKNKLWSSFWSALGSSLASSFRAQSGNVLSAEEGRGLSNAWSEFRDNLKENKFLNAPIEWEGREEAIKAFRDSEKVYKRFNNPNIPAARDAREKMEEARAVLERGDAIAGNGAMTYSPFDSSSKFVSGSFKGIGSSLGNTLVTLADAYASGQSKAVTQEDVISEKISGLEPGSSQKMREEAYNSEESRQFFSDLYDAVDKLGESGMRDLQSVKEGESALFGAGVDIAENLVELGFDAGAAAFTGGSSLVFMGARVFGQGAQEARQAGADLGQQILYGTATAGIEILTEKLGDGLAGVYGKGASDDIVEHVIRRLADTDTGASFLRIIAGANSEGLEEVISDLLNPLAKSIYNNKSVAENYNALQLEEIVYDYLIGAAVSVVSSAPGSITGSNNSLNQQMRTTNEVERRLLERGYDPKVASRLSEATVKQLSGQEISSAEQSLLNSYPNALPVVKSFFSDVSSAQNVTPGSREEFNRNAAETNARKQAEAVAAAQNVQAVSDIASEARPVSPLTQTLQNSDEAFDSSDQDSVDALLNSEPASLSSDSSLFGSDESSVLSEDLNSPVSSASYLDEDSDYEEFLDPDEYSYFSNPPASKNFNDSLYDYRSEFYSEFSKLNRSLRSGLSSNSSSVVRCTEIMDDVFRLVSEKGLLLSDVAGFEDFADDLDAFYKSYQDIVTHKFGENDLNFKGLDYQYFKEGLIDVLSSSPDSRPTADFGFSDDAGLSYEGFSDTEKGVHYDGVSKDSVPLFTRALARALVRLSGNRLSFHFYDRSTAQRDGQPVSSGLIGTHSEGNIFVDLSHNDPENVHSYILINTLSHEITHFIRRYNPKAYIVLADAVLSHQCDVLNMSLPELVADFRNNSPYSGDNFKMIDELVAFSCGEMLENKNAFSAFTKSHPFLSSLCYRVVERFRQRFNNYEKQRSYAESLYIYSFSKNLNDIADSVSSVWSDAFFGALQGVSGSYSPGWYVPDSSSNSVDLATRSARAPNSSSLSFDDSSIPYRPIPTVEESQQLDKEYFDSLKSDVENGAPSPASTEGIEDAVNEVRSIPLESNQSSGYIDSLSGEHQSSLGDDKSASDYDSSDAVLDDLSFGNISLDNAKRILGEMSAPSFEAPKGYTTYHEGAKATDYRPGYTVFFPNAESVPAGMHISNSTQTRKNVDDGSVAAYLPKDDSGFARSWVASLSSDSEISSAIENFKSILDSGREFSSTETAQIVALNNLLKSRKNESTASKGRFDAFVKDVYTPAMSLSAQSYRQFQSGKKDYDPVAQSAAIDKIISSLGLNEEQSKKLDALFYGSEDGESKGLLNRLSDVFTSYTELQNRLSAYKNDLSDTKLQNHRTAAQNVILGKLNADIQNVHQQSVNEINEFLSSAASQNAISGMTNLPQDYSKDKAYWHKQMSTALQMLFSDTGTPIRSYGMSDAQYDSLVSRAYLDKITDIANKTGIWFFSTPVEQADGSRSFESYASLGRNGPRIFNLDNFFALSNSSPDSYNDFIKSNDEVRENMKKLILEQAHILGTDTFSKKGKWALESLLNEFGDDFDYLVKVASQQQGRIAKAAGKPKLMDKIRSYQMNALLLTIPSIERNIGSNTVFSFLDTFTGNTLGKAFDTVLGSLTGVHGIPGHESYLTDSSLLRSSWQAFRKSIFEVALDVDPSNYQGYLADANLDGSPWDANGNVLNKVMSRWTQLTSYALGSTDVFFREAAQRSTQDSFKNAGIDVEEYRRLYGDEKFYSPLSQEPITVREAEKIINDIASSTGDYRLFTDKTLVNQAVTWIVNNLNGVDPSTGKYRSFGFGSIVAPVIKVPLNLASRAFEFTPLGAFRTVGQLARTVAAAKNHTLTAQQQRATSLSLARSVTGLGLAAILSSAFKAGIIKDYDDEDDKDVREYNRLHGRKGIMINWSAFLRAFSGESTDFLEGDHLSSAEWLEPIDSMFRFASALASDGSLSVSDIFRDSWSSSWNSVTSLPFFHTYTDIISELWNAATDNEFTFNDVLGTVGDVAVSGANQMIPNFVRNLAKGTDPYERDKSSDSYLGYLVNNIKYDLPVLRETLPVKKDALGEDVVQAGGNPYKSFANALLIPGTWSDYDNSELGSQLLDLAYSTGEMNVIPSKSPPDKFTFNGEDVYLSEAQQNSYYSAYTEAYRKFADEFLNSDYADLLSDDAKADILTSLAEKSKDYGKRAVLGDEYEDFKESSPKFETLRYAYSALNDSDGSEGAEVYSKVYKSLSPSEKQSVSENSSLGRQSLIKAVESDVPLDVYYTAKSYVDFLSDVKDYSATDEKTAFKSWVESSLPTHSLSSSQKSGLLNSFDFTSRIPAETASYDKLRAAGFDPVKSRNYYEVHSSLPEPFHSGDQLFLDKADNIGRYAAASDSPDDFLTSLEVFKSDFSQEAFFYYFYYQNPDAYSEEFIEDAYNQLGWTSKFSSSKRSNFKKIKKATGK